MPRREDLRPVSRHRHAWRDGRCKCGKRQCQGTTFRKVPKKFEKVGPYPCRGAALWQNAYCEAHQSFNEDEQHEQRDGSAVA